jgi:acyl-CoA dehydrogenase
VQEGQPDRPALRVAEARDPVARRRPLTRSNIVALVSSSSHAGARQRRLRDVQAGGGRGTERILIASEAIGDGYWFLDRATAYARERVVFDRPIGANQGIQFPLARAYTQVLAADMMRTRAAELFDAGEPCGAEANAAKLVASEASWQAGNACLDTHGGNGFVDHYDVERKFRETRMYQVAPISNNMVLTFLGQHVLGLPRSY